MSCQAGWALRRPLRDRTHTRVRARSRTLAQMVWHTYTHAHSWLDKPRSVIGGAGAWRNSGCVRGLFNILFVTLMRQFEDVCCCVTAPVRRICDVQHSDKQHSDKACFDCILTVSVLPIFSFLFYTMLYAFVLRRIRAGKGKKYYRKEVFIFHVEFWDDISWINKKFGKKLTKKRHVVNKVEISWIKSWKICWINKSRWQTVG